jgi:thymidylate kinase
MKVILLDGPDGSGKSTLADTLVKRGYQLIHFGVPPKEALKSEHTIFHFYLDQLYDMTRQHEHVVCDRSHLAEPIYGRVMRGGTKLTPRAEALLERYLEALDAQVVICLPRDYRISYNNWIARKGTEYVKESDDFRKIWKGYAHLLFNQKRNQNFLWYDYTRHQVGRFADALEKLAGHPLPDGMVGSQRPRFLFVGERPSAEGGKHDASMDLPFLSPNNSSGWFFDRLKDAGYQEYEMAFINAYKANGDPTNFDDLMACRFWQHISAVVALGQPAIQALFKAGLKCLPFAHPQFVKRFKSKDVEAYVLALADIRRRSR